MAATGTALLELRKVSFAASDGVLRLSDLDLTLHQGERVAILGGEGVGKSLLMRVMAGLHPLARGEIRLEGKRLEEWPVAERAARLGVLFDEAGRRFLASRVEEEISLAAAARGLAAEALQQRLIGALHTAGLPLTCLQRPVMELSSAFQARVALAGVLMARPALLLADEPGARLDTAGEEAWARNLAALSAESGLALLIFTSREERARRFAAHLVHPAWLRTQDAL
ncbi:MAG: ATP-binding cassette domain-containing protein [Magnetococcales bacterium]|nr:ATP-binding cassette domain-containing protein [Magnetococcales bacterium]